MIFLLIISFCKPTIPVYLLSLDTDIVLLLRNYCEMDVSIFINEYTPNKYNPVQYLKEECSINEEDNLIKKISDNFNITDWYIYKQDKKMFKENDKNYALVISESISKTKFHFVLPDRFLQEENKIELFNYKIDEMFLKLINMEMEHLIRNLQDFFVKVCKTNKLNSEDIKLKITKDIPKAKQIREKIQNILNQIDSVNKKFDILNDKIGLISYIRKDLEIKYLIDKKSDQICKIIRTYESLKKNVNYLKKKIGN